MQVFDYPEMLWEIHTYSEEQKTRMRWLLTAGLAVLWDGQSSKIEKCDWICESLDLAKDNLIKAMRASGKEVSDEYDALIDARNVLTAAISKALEYSAFYSTWVLEIYKIPFDNWREDAVLVAAIQTGRKHWMQAMLKGLT